MHGFRKEDWVTVWFMERKVKRTMEPGVADKRRKGEKRRPEGPPTVIMWVCTGDGGEEETEEAGDEADGRAVFWSVRVWVCALWRLLAAGMEVWVAVIVDTLPWMIPISQMLVIEVALAGINRVEELEVSVELFHFPVGVDGIAGTSPVPAGVVAYLTAVPSV